ncbi:hypothetical protein D5366_06980 [Neokomagataea tanensis]|uniref:Flagellar hook-length control protein FliK n=2 Tax=Acetobacteraceae TaxID=433 RepID=A0A4Y6V909_9PROT|nr:hypothetical protein D5366_06980 [Neokomagataea tanensis]
MSAVLTGQLWASSQVTGLSSSASALLAQDTVKSRFDVLLKSYEHPEIKPAEALSAKTVPVAQASQAGAEKTVPSARKSSEIGTKPSLAGDRHEKTQGQSSAGLSAKLGAKSEVPTSGGVAKSTANGHAVGQLGQQPIAKQWEVGPSTNARSQVTKETPRLKENSTTETSLSGKADKCPAAQNLKEDGKDVPSQSQPESDGAQDVTHAPLMGGSNVQGAFGSNMGVLPADGVEGSQPLTSGVSMEASPGEVSGAPCEVAQGLEASSLDMGHADFSVPDTEPEQAASTIHEKGISQEGEAVSRPHESGEPLVQHEKSIEGYRSVVHMNLAEQGHVSVAIRDGVEGQQHVHIAAENAVTLNLLTQDTTALVAALNQTLVPGMTALPTIHITAGLLPTQEMRSGRPSSSGSDRSDLSGTPENSENLHKTALIKSARCMRGVVDLTA